MGKWAGRATRRWRELRETVRRRGHPCWLCGQPIDYTIPYRNPDTGRVNPDTFTVDHKLARDTHPELAEDPANLCAAHHRCNLMKGTGQAPLSLGLQSEAW